MASKLERLSNRRSKVIISLSLLVATGLLLQSSTDFQEHRDSKSEFNRADIMFMNMMIIHTTRP